MKQRICIDTSVTGGSFDIEFKEFIDGNLKAVISDITLEELKDAPANVWMNFNK